MENNWFEQNKRREGWSALGLMALIFLSAVACVLLLSWLAGAMPLNH